MLLPVFDDFAAGYASGVTQAVWLTLPADLETPVSAMLKLGGDVSPMSFLLESVEAGTARGRYSVIGLAPDRVWRCQAGNAEINADFTAEPAAFHPAGAPPLAALRSLLAESRLALPPELPPMALGVFGYLGYDTVRLIEHLPTMPPDRLGLPDGLMLRPQLMLIFDAVTDAMTLVAAARPAPGMSAQGAYQAAAARIEAAEARLSAPLPASYRHGGNARSLRTDGSDNGADHAASAVASQSAGDPTGWLNALSQGVSPRTVPVDAGEGGQATVVAGALSLTAARHDAAASMNTPDGAAAFADSAAPAADTQPGRYRTMVAQAREFIAAGDIFQVVLSQRFSQPFTLPAFALYRALRRTNPSPYLYYFHCGDFQIAGSSPEILVRLAGGVVTVRPIAGTRPRGTTPAEDERLAVELLADEKERAEHLMLVDLGRNDAGRVAVPGSVRVTGSYLLERYAKVMHIVSNVEGDAAPGRDALDCLFAGFPAGTVSGAPKIRAMEIIDALEPVKRGLYAGAIGYFAPSGAMDSCIALRTAIVKDGIMHVQAGAGIVAQSEPEAEDRECHAKAAAVLAAAAEAWRFAPRNDAPGGTEGGGVSEPSVAPGAVCSRTAAAMQTPGDATAEAQRRSASATAMVASPEISAVVKAPSHGTRPA